MRIRLVATAVLLCLGVSAGCGEPPPVDTSLLTGEQCEPPCWQGLTPGESTLEEVNEFIRTSRFVAPCSVYRSALRLGSGEEVGEITYWHTTAGSVGPHNYFTVEGGVLQDTTIVPDYSLTLERLFERYGPPEKWIVSRMSVDRLDVEVTLFHPTHGFTVRLWLGPDDMTLEPESEVGEVWYFRAAPLERFLELRREAGYGGPPPDELLESLRDWPGYGAIEVD